MAFSAQCGSAACLPDDTLARYHRLALQVLETTGIRVPCSEVLSAMAEAGFKVSAEEQQVRFPPDLVEAALARIPRSITLGGRAPADDLELNLDSLWVRPQSGCVNVLDLDTGACRPATMADVEAMARLTDVLPAVHLAASLIYPNDVPETARDTATLAVLLNTTRKHIFTQPYDLGSATRMAEMIEVVRGGAGAAVDRPPVTFILAPTSPLVIAPNELAIMRCAAAHRIPSFFGATPMCGATGPMTLAGQVVLMHAENLAGLVVMQVLQPGAPVIYGIRPALMDMRTTAPLWGGVEFGLVSAVALQLARRKGLITDTEGTPTDSKALDEQTGLEKGFNAAFAALYGANIATGAGYIDMIMTASFEQLVIDNDISGMMVRARRGVEIDDDRLAVDLIEKVGSGGNYLTEPHTLRYLRTETFRPAVLDRQNRANWERAGARDVAAVARERAREAIRSHSTRPLPDHLMRELRRIAFGR